MKKNCSKKLLTKKYYEQNLLDQKNFGKKILSTKKISTEVLYAQEKFRPKILFQNKRIFAKQYHNEINFSTKKIFRPKKILDRKSIDQKIA